MTEVRKILDQLKTTNGVMGCGIVSKDGRPVEMRLPPNMNSETIAIMAATVFGGSMTLNTEAGKASPRIIKINSEGFKTTITQCGRRSLAVIMMNDNTDLEAVNGHLNKLSIEFGSN